MSAAPAPLVPPAPSRFERDCREKLRAMRRAYIKAGTWAGTKYDAIPRPAPRVRAAHSEGQHLLYLKMQAIGKGEHSRGRVGGKAPIWGKQNEKAYDYTIKVSVGALAELCGRPVSTIQDWLKQLEQKHSIIPMGVYSERKKTNKNREGTVFRLPDFDSVLEARREDDKIGKTHTHNEMLCWSNGRSNSNRLLTPEEAERWNLRMFEPDTKPAPKTKAEYAAPADAADELAKAKPAETEAPSAGSGSGAGVREALQAAKERVKTTTTTEPFAFWNSPAGETRTVEEHLAVMAGGFCDLAGEILYYAEKSAVGAGKTEPFPIEGLVECCQYALAKRLKRAHGRRELHVDNIPAFLRKCMQDEDHVAAYMNVRERRKIEAARRKKKADDYLRDQISEQLGQRDKHPDDPLCQQYLEDLEKLDAEVYATTLATHESNKLKRAETKGTRREVV